MRRPGLLPLDNVPVVLGLFAFFQGKTFTFLKNKLSRRKGVVKILSGCDRLNIGGIFGCPA